MTTFISRFLLTSLFTFSLIACGDKAPLNEPLPIIGNRLGITEKGDTIFPAIPNFAFVDQNGRLVSMSCALRCAGVCAPAAVASTRIATSIGRSFIDHCNGMSSLSEAKDLLFGSDKQVLRSAQDDSYW